ncbi:AAA family ATPase [bacterium]|nr:AAA family ATPase [bacterium]
MAYFYGILIGIGISVLTLVIISVIRRRMVDKEGTVAELIRDFFPEGTVETLTITERKFPYRVRADLQRAVDRWIAENAQLECFHGIRKEYDFMGITLAGCMFGNTSDPAYIVPPEYEDIDVGEQEPARVIKNGIWLFKAEDEPVALLLSFRGGPCDSKQMVVQFQTCKSPEAMQLATRFFDVLEAIIKESSSYRGKVLSFDQLDDAYSGESVGIRVHHLKTVQRDEIVLPAETIQLIERNVIKFASQREQLVRLGQSSKKGLLFYGVPGTGKTHTIHYLAGVLKGHTTLLISADEVKDLSEYMALARLLQPSVVVMEDVDLIARDRSDLTNPVQESMLNRLLNEMDGLKEDAEILFILTTNRPEALEAALASRPGRIDQAIEFPLPDEEGREKLIRLYARDLMLSEDCVAEIVRRTEGVSAAFIKELVRRSVQMHLESNGGPSVTPQNVDEALNEMLFHGDKLSLKLLGASSRIGYKARE